ncbi:MAG: ergothioneine biosynthesis protein EgtB [Gammaproteobacteria bacterium]|nr:ergothioneine biosynthesis protein EgtB [Gammaproteobacteria bacterium]
MQMSNAVTMRTNESLLQDYQRVRRDSVNICAPLETEDYGIQTSPEISPPKWHLAHTSWFFEAFLLNKEQADYRAFHPGYDYLFNSYYESVGTPFPRPKRGLLSRPTVTEILAYRDHVDSAMIDLIRAQSDNASIQFLVSLGLQHEQQHQELMYTDIKNIFAFNPLRPAYKQLPEPPTIESEDYHWLAVKGGLNHIGHGDDTFAYDNEFPRHRVLLEDVWLAHRPVNNREYLEFMQDGGYEDTRLWLSDGWTHINKHGWNSPLYWEQDTNGKWWHMTLSGMRPVDMNAPVTHVSFYEAHAYASWAGMRLPSEAEWEVAATQYSPDIKGNFRESGYLQPCSPEGNALFGDVWEWTQSPYAPYPGFKPLAGSIGEYNGKFMCNQMVLRGGSCVSPQNHLRHSYRNFFYPHERWQFTGIRLAKDNV